MMRCLLIQISFSKTVVQLLQVALIEGLAFLVIGIEII